MKTLFLAAVSCLVLAACGAAPEAETAAADAPATEMAAADAATEMAPVDAHDAAMHAGHDGHVHGEGCGHPMVAHDDHMDYLDGGHLHFAHDGHYDEHVIAVSDVNPDAEAPLDPAVHAGHMHGEGDGEHVMVPHGDHMDYVHDGRLHFVHGDHVDDHGPVTVVPNG